MLHVNLFVQILSDLILILSDLIWSYLILSDFWKWVAPAGETTHLKKGSENSDFWKWVASAGETAHLKKNSEKSDFWKWATPKKGRWKVRLLKTENGSPRRGSIDTSKRALIKLVFFRFFEILKPMGKSFPHPLGVFCTIPNLPKCHIMQKIEF